MDHWGCSEFGVPFDDQSLPRVVRIEGLHPGTASEATGRNFIRGLVRTPLKGGLSEDAL